MSQSYSYVRNGVIYVSVNPWVAKRRNDNAPKSPFIGKMVQGKLVPTNHYGKI
jgi:hypothetical protein